jgi:3-dehydroquinate synthase
MGLLSGGDFFDDLSLIPAARAGDLDALQTLVLHSIRFKARVVAEDELEGGMRAILNYGHTIGHALESAANYGLPHGSAIAAGMLAEAILSRDRFGKDLVGVHEDFIAAASLSGRVPGVDVDRTLDAMGTDKKRTARDGPAGHRFVLLEDVGKPVRNVPVSEDEAREAIGAIVG